MKHLNQFFTLYLFIFLLLGIILYEACSLYFVDEILTLILIIYTIAYVGRTKKRINKEISWFIAIAVFYLIYSFAIEITNTQAILLDFQQQIKPYAAFYCTWILAPQFTQKQKTFLHRYIGLLSIASIVILVTGNTTLFFGGFSASLATTALTLSLFYYYFTPEKPIYKKKSLLIMALGLFSLKAKFFSEFIIAIYLFIFRKVKLKLSSPKVIFTLSIFIMIIIYIIWDKLNFYYIEGWKYSDGIARPMLYKVGIEILQDYFPLGSGLGTFCNDAARTIYSPLFYKYDLYQVWGLTPDNPQFATDCFYPTLAQFGIVGVALFILFWYRRWSELKEIIDYKYYSIGVMAMVVLLFDNIADSTYLGNRGVLFFVLLALTLRKKFQ